LLSPFLPIRAALNGALACSFWTAAVAGIHNALTPLLIEDVTAVPADLSRTTLQPLGFGALNLVVEPTLDGGGIDTILAGNLGQAGGEFFEILCSVVRMGVMGRTSLKSSPLNLDGTCCASRGGATARAGMEQ
jgi:hypothetical protein